MRLVYIVVLFGLSLLPRLALAPPPAPVQPVDVVAYGPFDPGSGWLLTRDRLFLTLDEGLTWRNITPAAPGSDFLASDFIAGGSGWLIASSPDQDALSIGRTSDFGASWRWTPLSLASADEPAPAISELQLHFLDSTEGTLRVKHVSSSNFERRSEWRTTDGGENWALTARFDVAASPNPPAPGPGVLPNGQDGWRLERSGRCTPGASGRACVSTLALRSTHDGGQNWRDLALPDSVGAPVQSTVSDQPAARAAAAETGGLTMIAVGQGFDKCEVPTYSQLQDWRWSSPYSAVNLYIGGAARACANSALSAAYLRDLNSMGWTFIPTWVGPQAPCTTFRSRLSYDPATAQSQGWAEANAAADTLARLGLTEPAGTGSVAYYDMESFNTGDGACNAAVQSFFSGWDQGMRARGHLAGVYALGPALSLLAGLPQPPDAIWPAHWIDSSYDPAATVWNVYRLGNDVWVNHQRLRQYAGGHSETWGSTALNIDSNVLDGPVALAGAPRPTSTPSPTATATRTATPTPTAAATQMALTPRARIYVPLLLQE